MPSQRLKRSSDSVKIRSLDGPGTIRKLKSIGSTILKSNDRVTAVYLFGSLACGRYAPGSDADILIVLQSDQQNRVMDRIPEFARYFLDLALDVDVFPYTREELDAMLSSRLPFAVKMWDEKIPLALRTEENG